METGEAPTDRFPAPLAYRVFLPPCYDNLASQRYPVLYLLHGQYYADDQWDRLGVDETAASLVIAGEIPPLIIVMPYEIGSDPPEESPFGEMVASDLVPWIDQTYRTIPDRSHRALGGLSRGAGWAVHVGLTHWEVFGAIGAHSLPVFWADADKLPGQLLAISPEAMPRLYLDIGKKDSDLDSAQEFAAMLDGMNIPHEWHLYDGYHSEDYWKSHVKEYLYWYTQDWY
jgi:enterochelin esterase-like enzyme